MAATREWKEALVSIRGGSGPVTAGDIVALYSLVTDLGEERDALLAERRELRLRARKFEAALALVRGEVKAARVPGKPRHVMDALCDSVERAARGEVKP